MKKNQAKMQKLLHDARIETATAKSRNENTEIDALKKKGPVGGGAGGGSRLSTKGKGKKDRGGGSDSDRGSDEDEDKEALEDGANNSDEEDADLDIEVQAFRYTSQEQDTGYFWGRYNNNKKGGGERFDVKETLVDFPETTLKYIYDKYGHHSPTVHYIEQVCLEMWTYPESTIERQVVIGFTTLEAYVQALKWPRMEAKWKKTTIPMCDKAVVKVGKTKGRQPLPSRKRANNKISLATTTGLEATIIQPSEMMTGIVPIESAGIDNSITGVLGIMVPASLKGTSAQPNCVKKRFMAYEKNDPLESCANGKNHVWDEFSSGTYVLKGGLSGEKTCIGVRNGKKCGRLFVCKAISAKVHETETEFHPTCQRPAYGCTICFNCMCCDCKNHYETNVRCSPGKKGRHVRITNKGVPEEEG
jgi:hypothetical protein